MVHVSIKPMQIHVPPGRPSAEEMPDAPQVRLRLIHPEFGILLNYQCPIHSKCFPATTVLAPTIVQAPPRDPLRMPSQTLHLLSLSLPSGVPQFVPRQFVPSVVPLPVPVIVPAALPIQAVVRIAAKNVLQERGPR